MILAVSLAGYVYLYGIAVALIVTAVVLLSRRRR